MNNIFAYIPNQLVYSYGYNNANAALDADVQEVLRLSKKLAIKNQQLQTTVHEQKIIIAEQAEKVKVYDRIAASEDAMSVRDAAKVLQVKPSILRNWLLDNEWMWHQASGYRVYQRILNQGLMKHKIRVRIFETGFKANVVTQVLITGKGLVQLGRMV